MISVGLWGAQLGAPAVWLLPVTFPMVMAVGGFLGLVGMRAAWRGDRHRALGAAARRSMVATRGETAARGRRGAGRRSSPSSTGTRTEPSCRPARAGSLYSIGFVAATGCLHGVGIVIGVVHRWPLGRTALRLAGAAVAISGSAFLWRALA